MDDTNTLPIIDWDLGMKLAGNDLALAKDILTMLMKNLPNDLAKINQLCAEQNYAALKRHIHTVRGAVAYCGTPRLKAVLTEMEIQLKSSATNTLPHLLNLLHIEVNNLNKAYNSTLADYSARTS